MTKILIDRAVVEQALEALSLALSDVDWRANSPTQPVIHKAHTALRAALAEPVQEPVQEPVAQADPEPMSPEQRQRWEELAAMPRQADPQKPVESALQAVAEKIGDQCAVWYGIGARDVEEVLREAVRHGLVHGAALAEPVQEPVPNDDEVLCPACCHQFRAIPPNVQRMMLDVGFEPPFTAPPQRPAETDTDCHAQGICQRSGYSVAQEAEPSRPRTASRRERD